jgi:hypothetical protein
MTSTQNQIRAVELDPYTSDGHVLSWGVSSDRSPTVSQLLDTSLNRLKVSEHETKFWEISLEETH